MFNIRRWVIWSLCLAMTGLIACRAAHAIRTLVAGDQTAFLAFPLGVILPGIAFAFLATRRDMISQEGTMMQLGAMIQLALIIALPGFALYLALGFPVVFLVVELFETRLPAPMRDLLKGLVLT